MRKTIVVAVREYQAAVRTKAFLIGLIIMPLFMLGSFLVPKLLEDAVDISDRHIAVIDETGALFDVLTVAAQTRNEQEIYQTDGNAQKQTRPRFLFERVRPGHDDVPLEPDELAISLSDQVRSRKLFAFMTIGSNVISPESDGVDTAVEYHSNNPAYDDVRRWTQAVLTHHIQQTRLDALGLDAQAVAAAMAQVPVENLSLVSRDSAGKATEAKKTNEAASLLIPFGMLMLMLMVVMVGAQPLVQSVLEEKMQRIAEVLLGSIPPFQLMMGKLLGMVGVSLTIGTIYLVGAFVGLHKAGFGQFFPAHLVLWFVTYQALAVFLFGSLFVAIGAAVSDLKEAQSLVAPITLVIFLPMFVWLNVIREPSAPLSVVLSLIPPFTPMLMVLRQSAPASVPIWQPLLGIALMLATTIVFVFAAGRIFRVGILMQGKGARVGEMLRWALRG